MESRCNSIGNPWEMAEAEKSDGPGVEFTITLPGDAIEMIENGLIPFGLYGKRRATICRSLILDMLKSADVQRNVAEGRGKARATESA